MELARLRKILELISELEDYLSFEDYGEYEALKKDHIEPLRQVMTRRLSDLENALLEARPQARS